MVMSDYGMTSDIDLVPIYLDNYLDLSYIQYVIVGSGYAQIIPYALEQQKILNSLKEIKDGNFWTLAELFDIECPISSHFLSLFFWSLEGVDVYMASQLQDPPITDTRVVPDYLHYGKGEFAQDILVVTQPGN